MEIKRVKYFFILVDDYAGAVARVAKFLRSENVDLAGLWGFGVGRGKCQIFVVPKESDDFRQTVEKAGWQVKEGTCYQLHDEDKLGCLVDVLDKLADAGINLHGVDAIGVQGNLGCYIWPSENDADLVGEVLGVA